MFLLLIAGILISVSAPSQGFPPGYPVAMSLAGTVLLTVVGALSGLLQRLTPSHRGLLTGDEHLAWDRRATRLIWLRRGILLGSYVYVVHGFHWPAFVSTTLGLGDTVALGQLLVLAPFLLSLLGALILGFPALRRASGRTWNLGQYLVYVLRQYWAFLLIPWFLYVVVLDLMDMLVTPRLPIGWRGPVEWSVVLGMMVSLYAFWPLALRWIWPTHRLPDGPLRESLEELCRRAGVGYREMLVWRSPVGGLANAAVAGLAAPVRYILLTDTLLERLEPQEVEAVLGHELGHVRRRHIPYYVVFAVGFVALAVLTDFWLEGRLPEPTLSADPGSSLLDLAVAAVVVGVYWGVLFGWISRRFEQEADLDAAGVVGSGEVFAQALEKIAYINGRSPEKRGWRHFSIARRARFLREADGNGAVREGALAQVALIRRVLLAGTVAVVVLAGLALVAL